MSFLDGLNPEQRLAAEHDGGHLLILAGAGTGKTRTLVHRLGWLLEQGQPAHQLLVITFTNKAAAELKERLKTLVGHKADAVISGTFHGVAARLLRRLAPAIGWSSDFIIYDDADQRSLVSGLLSSADQVTPGGLLKAMEQRRLNPEIAVPTWDRAGQLAKARLPEYRAALERAGAVDFQGLIEGFVALVEGGHAPGFREVMVDEFQDTDRLQHRLLEGFAARGARVVAVGDDDQSIYGWRGADVSGMLKFEQRYQGAHRVTLDRNYRSVQTVLDAANRLIGKNKQRLGKDLLGHRGAGDPVEVTAVRDERAEQRQVVRQLSSWVELGEPASQLAVLARTNAQLRGIEVGLAGARIPYRLVGGRALFETREVRDVMAYLRLWAQPDSDLDLLRVINRPTRGLGRVAVEKVRTAAEGQPLLPFIRSHHQKLDKRTRRGLEALLELMDPPPADVREALERVIYDGGYLEWACAREPERADDREANLISLIDSASTLAGPSLDLIEFLEAWSLAGGGDLGRGEGVRLMTIHASKGLEFKAVCLPGWDEGLFPMPDPEGERFDQLEEERRLAYVALTRARDRAVITWAQSRMHHGRTLPGRPSRFIAEIAGEGVQGYAHHPLDGRKLYGLTTPSQTAQRPTSSYDELAQFDYGDREGGVYAPGDAVTHERFGSGVIQSLRGSGASTKVEVRFTDGSVRTIIASFLQPDDTMEFG